MNEFVMERRPHWTDDLIEAAKEAYPSYYEDESDLYQLIAAVEDWQESRWDSISESPMEVAVQFNAMEAAIERVLKLCANRQRCLDPAIKHPTAISSISIDEVLQALDGDDE